MNSYLKLIWLRKCLFLVIFPVNNFESGFTGFSGLQRTSLFRVQWSFVEDYLVLFFSPMRNASAGCFEMKAPINNNLPNQTNDVIINPGNPENPDSKSVCKYQEATLSRKD